MLTCHWYLYEINWDKIEVVHPNVCRIPTNLRACTSQNVLIAETPVRKWRSQTDHCETEPWLFLLFRGGTTHLKWFVRNHQHDVSKEPSVITSEHMSVLYLELGSFQVHHFTSEHMSVLLSREGFNLSSSFHYIFSKSKTKPLLMCLLQ